MFEIGRCDLCRKYDLDTLCLHEIARGCYRHLAIMDKSAQLCVCWRCHTVVDKLSIPQQLCLLRLIRPEDFDLCQFNSIVARKVDLQQILDTAESITALVQRS